MTISQTAGMGVYSDRVLPRLIDRACGSAQLMRWRARVADGLHGDVVEIGFGSGLNVPVYPDAVQRVWAVDPSVTARRLAHDRIAASSVTIDHIAPRGEALPLADGSCDGALSTFTLCTVGDPTTVLAELHRVLRPGAQLHFLEHGLAPDPGVQRWQHRINPLQKRLADGCHLTRDPLDLITNAGFDIVDQHARYVPRAPRAWGWFTGGVARRR